MKQWVPAPTTNAKPAPNALLGVSLNPGELVRWAYAILPDGKRIVTGYDIFPQEIPWRLKKKRSRVVKK